MAVSVLILTLNEEANLPSCLAALDWCDDIIVLDSFSRDQTLSIAQDKNARVFQREFDNFAAQRNWALETVNFSYDWVLHLDADEIVSEELHREIELAVHAQDFDAFKIPSKMIFQGRWLRYAGMYPSYQVRLTRRAGFRFKQVGHGQKEDHDSSSIGTLESPYLHYSFSKGIDDWFARHNRYSSEEALELLAQRQGAVSFRPGNLFTRDSYQRRQALKKIIVRLPFRPLIRFFYMYIYRRGFLDGTAGFHYCCLLVIYEYMISLKLAEARASQGQ